MRGKHAIETLKTEITSGFNKAAVAKKITKDYEGEMRTFIMVIFPRTRWVMYENTHYYEDLESTESGENEYYKHVHMIPKYSVFKNREKVSIALPRVDQNDKPYLFIPKGWKKGVHKLSNKDRSKYSLSKEFYIFNINEEFLIEEYADIYFTN